MKKNIFILILILSGLKTYAGTVGGSVFPDEGDTLQYHVIPVGTVGGSYSPEIEDYSNCRLLPAGTVGGSTCETDGEKLHFTQLSESRAQVMFIGYNKDFTQFLYQMDGKLEVVEISNSELEQDTQLQEALMRSIYESRQIRRNSI